MPLVNWSVGLMEPPSTVNMRSATCDTRVVGLRMVTILPIAMFAPLPTFLPHLGHHHVLVLILFVVTSLDTMACQDCRWNEPAMRNSVAAVDVRKSTSMTVVPIPALRMEEHGVMRLMNTSFYYCSHWTGFHLSMAAQWGDLVRSVEP
jgi:hypothetical protein